MDSADIQLRQQLGEATDEESSSMAVTLATLAQGPLDALRG
jgi:hypothetical protein